MRLSIAAGLIAACVLGPRSARADEAKPVPPERRVSIDLKDTPLRKALQDAVAGKKVEVTVEKDVTDLPITLALRDVDVETAVRLIVRAAARKEQRLLLVQRGDSYTVQLDPAAMPESQGLDRFFPKPGEDEPKYVSERLYFRNPMVGEVLGLFMRLVKLGPERGAAPPRFPIPGVRGVIETVEEGGKGYKFRQPRYRLKMVGYDRYQPAAPGGIDVGYSQAQPGDKPFTGSGQALPRPSGPSRRPGRSGTGPGGGTVGNVPTVF